MKAAAARLEAALGDPFSDGAIAFSRMVELDEREAYPEAECRALDALGLPRHYVPTAHGGVLESFEVLAEVVRVVARRDLTVAIAHAKSFLAAVPVWLAGSDAQRRQLAELLLGGGQAALCLTEQDHGSDLRAIETTAERQPGGYLLSGEKWLINNATRGRALIVLARTAPDGGPRSSSLFLVDKAALAPGSCVPLPKLKTHGIRGADISGVRFQGATLPSEARLGAEGHGLEIALKGLFVTRSLIGALSLGAADTALRCVVGFARSRRLGQRTVVELPHARAVFADAFADLLAGEALTATAARSLHVVPEQVSVFSAVAKYVVPTSVDGILRQLAVVLGARHYLREGHCHGVFQKLVRDAALVSLFDGSTLVNLNALALQLPRLTAQRVARAAGVDAGVAARRPALFGVEAPLPAFDPARLALVSRGRDDVLEALPLAMREEEASGRGALRELLSRLATALADAPRALAALEGRGAAGADAPEMFALAERHALLFAGAVCVHFWQVNRDSGDSFFAEGEWLVAALARLLDRAGHATPVPPSCRESLVRRVEALTDANRSFSLFPMPLAARG